MKLKFFLSYFLYGLILLFCLSAPKSGRFSLCCLFSGRCTGFICQKSFLMFLYFILAYSIGCFKDKARRAIRTLERRSRFLKGHYRRRRDAIRKCFQAAYRRGYKVFALQHQGWCASSRMAHLTYRKYGKSNRCRNGKGGPWANDVYVLRGQYLILALFSKEGTQ